MTKQFAPDPTLQTQIAIDLNRRTVAVDDPYLTRLGLFTNDQMVASEILAAEATEPYSALGYWTTRAQRNYFLTARPRAAEAFLLLWRFAPEATVLSSSLGKAIATHLEETEQMSEVRDLDQWRSVDLPALSKQQARSLRAAPELTAALEVALVKVAIAQGLVWPMNRLQLCVLWRMVRLFEDERAFSLEYLRDVCSSSWFLSLESRPKRSDVF